MTPQRTAVSLAIALTAGLMLFFPVPALAQGGGGFGMGGQGGDDDPPTSGGGGYSDEDYNPTVHCTGEGGISAMLTCLYYGITGNSPFCAPNPPAGSLTGPGGTVMLPGEPGPTCFDPQYRSDWNVTIFDWGLHMQRVDNQPMRRIAFREVDPGIQTTRVFIEDTQELVGRIRKLTASAVGSPDTYGTIYVTVGWNLPPLSPPGTPNEVTISVSTAIYKTAAAINNRIRSLLVNNGFLVYDEGNYIYVVRNTWSDPWGVRLIRYRSTDPDVISSDLALYKYGEFDAIPAGFQPPQQPE